MNNKSMRIIEQLLYFLFLGIAIALIISLFKLMSYLLIWGSIIGLLLWAGFSIKNYLVPSSIQQPSNGRIIEHDEN